MSNKLHSLLPKSHLGQGIMTLAGSTAVAQVVTACTMPIVTRLYSPAEIGVISLFITFFGFWSSLLSCRYESALLIVANDTESHLVFRVGSGCVVLMSLLSIPVLLGLVGCKAFGFGLIPLWSAAIAVPIFLGYGLFMMYRAWGLRAGFVRDIGRATVARSVSNAAVRVALGLLGGGIPGLFVAEFAGAWGPTAVLYRSIHRHYAVNHLLINRQRLIEAAKKYSKFPKYEMPSVAIDVFMLAIPVPMIASLYGAQAVGWFGLARLMVAIPNAQVGRAVSDMFQMELAQKIREHDFLAARKLFYELLRKLSLFGLFPLIGLMTLSPLLVPWIFGKPWAEMGVIMVCIAPWMYAAFVVSSLSSVTSVLQHQEYKLIYDISTLLLIVLVYVISWKWSLTLIPAVILLTAASIIGYVIYLFVQIRIVSNHISVSA